MFRGSIGETLLRSVAMQRRANNEPRILHPVPDAPPLPAAGRDGPRLPRPRLAIARAEPRPDAAAASRSEGAVDHLAVHDWRAVAGRYLRLQARIAAAQRASSRGGRSSHRFLPDQRAVSCVAVPLGPARAIGVVGVG